MSVRLKHNKKVVSSIIALVIACCSSFMAFAATYIYYSNGYISSTIPIENRVSYSEFDTAISAWNGTSTPAYIYTVPGSGNNWMIDNLYATTWQALYTPVNLQYIVFGRATKFKIELNRKYLVSCTSNEKTWTMVHELGHALTLGDNPSNTTTPDASIMNYGSNRQNYTPRADDITGVNATY